MESPSPIAYKLRVSRRARRMRIAVYHDSSVVVTVPFGFPKVAAEKFVISRLAWLRKALEYYKGKVFIKPSKTEYRKSKQQALELARSKVEQWNRFYGFSVANVNIKSQKTRWGSCSKRGNLNFNYRIVHLPETLLDYLVVHELCHLREFNHSRKFWELVAQTMPDYKAQRQSLRKMFI